MLNIDIQRTGIPIKIAGIEFFFDASLESVENYHLQYDEIIKSIEELPETENVLEDTKKALEKSFDAVLGNGAFKKLYKKVPDVIALRTVFFEVVRGIDEYTESFLQKYQNESEELLALYRDKQANFRGWVVCG